MTLTRTQRPESWAPRARNRRAVGLPGALIVTIALLLAVALSLTIGAKALSPAAVFDALTGGPEHPGAATIVWELRLPRTVIGLLAGAALGAAGALMQALTRNPLADPGLLGVNAGAGFAVVIAVGVFGVSEPSGFVWFAFAGAALAAPLVFAVGAAGRAGAEPVRLTLAGLAVGAVLTGLSSAVALLDPSVFNQLRYWGAGPALGAGSIAGRTMTTATAVAPFIVVAAVLGLVAARSLNAVALGDDVARSLGVRVGRTRILTGVAITLLCGAATAAAGPIAFVGLAVPHIARRFAGTDQRLILGHSAALGAVLLLGADVIGRIAAPPGELPAGIVTAFLGAPVLIALARGPLRRPGGAGRRRVGEPRAAGRPAQVGP